MKDEIHIRSKVDLDRHVRAGYREARNKKLYVLNLLDTNEFDYEKYQSVKKHVDMVIECLEEMEEKA